MLNGIDISNYQAGIPQSVIAQADVIICKATEGTGYQDPHLFDNFSKAANAGKKVGAYHFWRPGASGAAQASYFINYLKANQLTVDFAVLDFEDESDLANESGALEFMQIVEQKLGVKCWFYCYVNPLKTYGYWQIRKKHKFWLAGYYLGYQQVQGFNPPMSLDEYIVFNGIDSTGIDFAGWQYTPVGRLNGYAGDLDLNMFYEDAFTTPTTQNVSASSQTITLMPVTGFTVTQNFGDGKDLSSNTGVGHSGMDFATPVGTPAISLEAGTVLWADWAHNLPSTSWVDRWFIGSRGFAGLPIDAGICIVIQHGTWISTYSHMNKTDLNPGDRVVQGQVVGETGYTGYTYNSVTGFAYEEPRGAHLHFEALVDTTNYYTTNDGSMIYGRVDPRPYFIQTIESANKLASATVLRSELEKEKKELSILTEKFKNFKTGGETDAATELGWLPQNFQTVFESIANIRKEVLNQKILKQGATQKQGEMTSLALEVAYLADNFARTHQALARIEARLNQLEGK